MRGRSKFSVEQMKRQVGLENCDIFDEELLFRLYSEILKLNKELRRQCNSIMETDGKIEFIKKMEEWPKNMKKIPQEYIQSKNINENLSDNISYLFY